MSPIQEITCDCIWLPVLAELLKSVTSSSYLCRDTCNIDHLKGQLLRTEVHYKRTYVKSSTTQNLPLAFELSRRFRLLAALFPRLCALQSYKVTAILYRRNVADERLWMKKVRERRVVSKPTAGASRPKCEKRRTRERRRNSTTNRILSTDGTVSILG